MGDQRTKSSDGRGGLPRTNRPRPQHARRPGERISGTHAPASHHTSGQRETEESGAPALEFQEVASDEETESDRNSASFLDRITGESSRQESGTRLGGSATGDEPPQTRREGAAGSAPGFSPAMQEAGSLEDLAQRPTQLDARTGADTRRAVPTTLRRVTFAPGGGAQPASGPGSNAYIDFVIDGRYRIASVIGRGGMGVVYQARHEIIDKSFAVKILPPTAEPEVVERFMNEARAASSIGNAHIVDTVDFGKLPDDSTYFVMELLEGKTLSKVIRSDKFVPIPRAINIAKQIAEAMAAAHAAKIVHRDLKPDNIFVTHREKVGEFIKLLDFGIAKIANAQNKLTRAGTIFGTPHYMSPEQASGVEVDPRTDIYSLGVILYEMVAGRVPFEAENPMGLLTQHMYVDPKPLTELEELPQPIPIALDAVVLKCLAKKPDDRYASMDDLHTDLDRFERGALPSAISELVSRVDEKEHAAVVRAAKAAITAGRKRSRWPRVLFTMLLLGGAAAGGALYLKKHPIEPEPLPQVVVPEIPDPAPETTPSAPPPAPKFTAGEVLLFFNPSDAQVFRGNVSLGTSPVTVPVNEGEQVEVEVRREGFKSQKVVIDGSKPYVHGRLEPIPGVRPMIPVPIDSPDRYRAWKDSILKRAPQELGIPVKDVTEKDLAPAAENRAPESAEAHPAKSAEAPAETRRPSDNPYGEETP